MNIPFIYLDGDGPDVRRRHPLRQGAQRTRQIPGIVPVGCREASAVGSCTYIKGCGSGSVNT